MVNVDCGEPRTHDGFDHSGTHSGVVVADGPGPILSQAIGGDKQPPAKVTMLKALPLAS